METKYDLTKSPSLDALDSLAKDIKGFSGQSVAIGGTSFSTSYDEGEAASILTLNSWANYDLTNSLQSSIGKCSKTKDAYS